MCAIVQQAELFYKTKPKGKKNINARGGILKYCFSSFLFNPVIGELKKGIAEYI